MTAQKQGQEQRQRQRTLGGGFGFGAKDCVGDGDCFYCGADGVDSDDVGSG